MMAHRHNDLRAPAITAALLAGGFSRRLGQDKARVKIGGEPLALKVVRALAAVGLKPWLITNQPLLHADFGLPLVTDLVPFQGPAGGLVTALFYAQTPWVLAVAVDNPFLAPALLAELVRRAGKTSRPAVVCCSPGGLEPFPGLYAIRLLPRLQEFLRADRRPTRFLEICHPQIMRESEVGLFDPGFRSFFNLNTPRDLKQAAKLLAERPSASAPPLPYCLPGSFEL